MKFSEKLQILRKQNNLSQEQLADQLDVSRQSVSKWESGTTYPEMDKLLTICKIFKCSLDDLTNDEISELNIKERKNNFSNFIEEILYIMKKTILMFKNMKFKDYVLFIIELIILLVFIYLLYIPFNYIGNLGSNVFYNFGDSAGRLLTNIFDFLLAITHVILSLFIVFYVFKIRHLDNTKEIEEVEVIEKDLVINQESKPVKEVVIKEKKPSVVFQALGKLVIFFVKFITFLFGLPFVFAFIACVIILIVTLILIFKSVIYFGLITSIVGSILLLFVILNIIYYFLFSRKIEVKKTFIIFIASIAVIGAGIGILSIEIANTNYSKDLSDIKMASIDKTIKMHKDLIYPDRNSVNATFVIDEKMKDTVKFEVKYYQGFNKITIVHDNPNVIYFYGNNDFSTKAQFDLIIKDLAKKTFRDYNMLYQTELVIYSSSNNINILKSNMEKAYEEQEQQQIESEKEALQNEIDSLTDNVSDLNDKIYELENNISDLDYKLTNKEQELQEYKDRIKDLLEN